MGAVLVGLVALFAVVGAVIGARLFRLGARTGEIPERLLGWTVVAYACGFVPFATLIAALPSDAAIARVALIALYASALASTAPLYTFNYLVFRRGRRWARLLVGAGVALPVVLLCAAVAGVPRAQLAPLTSANSAVVCTWAGIEAMLRYRNQLRQRRIGLGDAALRNRFLVWGTSMCLLAVLALGLFRSNVAGDFTGFAPLPTWIPIANVLVAMVGWTLAFAPPDAYVAWVVGRDKRTRN